ncbi:hypothetical protein RhiirA1_405756 [Rhizophagus irregularis]|uniref:Uncharacterized protein n=1 Tax=Rhizophagus irregularis TaxID=588596 RepID=A0A2N0QIZ3_9GLOM|nr:hypothetical protein RhiirA1_405756 [Rhizophagus irregularis]
MAPIVILLTPIIVSSLFLNDPDRMVLITYGKNIIIYTLSFGIAFLAIFIIKLFKKIISKLLTGSSVQYYIHINDDYIEYNPFFGATEKYEWSKISRVIHELPTDQYEEKYIFELYDGSKFEFIPTAAITKEMKMQIDEKILTMDVSFEEY